MLTELRKQVVVVNVKAVVVFAPKNVQNVFFQKLSITLILPSGNIGIDVVAWAEKKLVLNGEARKHQLKQSYSTQPPNKYGWAKVLVRLSSYIAYSR